MEQISDDEDIKVPPTVPGKKRRRPIGRKQAGGAWVSDAEFDDDYEDEDAALTDDLVNATFEFLNIVLSLNLNRR